MATNSLVPAHLQRNEIACNAYTVKLQPGVVFEDLFRPVFWAHNVTTLRRYDTITVVAHDFSFDVTLRVVAVSKGGVHVQISPRIPELGEVKAQEVPYIRGKLAVRVEHTKATNWRVIALDQNELASGFETKEAAESVMAKYLAELNLVLPTTPPPADVKSPTPPKAPAKDKETA